MSTTLRALVRVITFSTSFGGIAILLAGCGGAQSGATPSVSSAGNSALIVGRLPSPQIEDVLRQTIWISNDTGMYLFHGDGQNTKPYAKLGIGPGFEIAVDANRTLYAPTESFPGGVYEYPWGSKTGTALSGVVGPQGVAVDSDGTIYVSDCGYHNCGDPYIKVYAPGKLHPTRTILHTLNGQLAVDQRHRLFVADIYGFIDYYDKGSSKFNIANFQGVQVPSSIAVDGKENYYVSSLTSTSRGQNAVLQYGSDGPTGGPASRIISSDGGPNGFYPENLAVDDHQNLYVYDQANLGVAVYAPGQTSPYSFIPYAGAIAVSHSF